MTSRVLLITGTVGGGKTSVLLEIGEALASADAPYAIVDLDWLAWLRPSPDSGLTVQAVLEENFARVAATFRSAGVERLTVARLTAQPAEIARRLTAHGTGLPLAEHLREALQFAAEAESAGIGDVIVATDDRAVSSVARELLVSVGWAST